MLRSAGGAALMGAGGVMAFGCSVGQGLTGLSTLALASFVAVAGIMVGTAAGLRGALARAAAGAALAADSICRLGHDANLRGQRAMHRALVGDFHQPLALIGVERAFHRDHPVDLVEHAFLVSHSAQSSAWILLCFSVTVTRSSGSDLRSAYIRMVIDVQAPRPASTKS